MQDNVEFRDVLEEGVGDGGVQLFFSSAPDSSVIPASLVEDAFLSNSVIEV